MLAWLMRLRQHRPPRLSLLLLLFFLLPLPPPLTLNQRRGRGRRQRRASGCVCFALLCTSPPFLSKLSATVATTTTDPVIAVTGNVIAVTVTATVTVTVVTTVTVTVQLRPVPQPHTRCHGRFWHRHQHLRLSHALRLRRWRGHKAVSASFAGNAASKNVARVIADTCLVAIAQTVFKYDALHGVVVTELIVEFTISAAIGTSACIFSAGIGTGVYFGGCAVGRSREMSIWQILGTWLRPSALSSSRLLKRSCASPRGRRG